MSEVTNDTHKQCGTNCPRETSIEKKKKNTADRKVWGCAFVRLCTQSCVWLCIWMYIKVGLKGEHLMILFDLNFILNKAPLTFLNEPSFLFYFKNF